MENRKSNRALLILVTAITSLLVVEITASALLFYKNKGAIPEFSDQPTSSILLLINRTITGRNTPPLKKNDVITKSDPSPMYVFDPVQGYSMKPGKYSISFLKTDSSKSKPFIFKATILNDGSRFVGNGKVQESKDTSHVFVFGDSFVYGTGVNDEQTFSYHLQQALPDRYVRLFAVGGYSLTNAYINMQRLKPRLNGNDVVILGYASFYGIRQVAAPSRLREYGKKYSRPHRSPEMKHVKVDIDESGKMTFGLVPLFCEDAGDYCNQKDPDKAYIDKVSVRLINEIAKASNAKVFLLHMMGDKSDPVLNSIDPSVTIVSVLPEDFEHEVNDRIMDYDHHPGPYWHYAVYTRLKEAISRDTGRAR
jgi:hypothetical protein